MKGTIRVTRAKADATVRKADERNKHVILKNCAPFTDCISEIDNTQADNAKDLDVAMPMYNLVGYNNDYVKTSAGLC